MIALFVGTAIILCHDKPALVPLRPVVNDDCDGGLYSSAAPQLYIRCQEPDIDQTQRALEPEREARRVLSRETTDTTQRHCYRDRGGSMEVGDLLQCIVQITLLYIYIEI